MKEEVKEEVKEERPGIGATMTYEEIVEALIGQVGSVEYARLTCPFLCPVCSVGVDTAIS